MLVLIDGRGVYSPLFHGVYWEVQDTLLKDIERIEVIRGPGGTIWGANAVNAVINIITKSAKDTHGTLLSVGGGNIDQRAVGFRYGGGSRNNLHYRFYGKGFSRGPEFHPDGRQFDDWRMGQAGFRADWESNRRDTLTFQGDIYDGDAGERVTIARYSPPSAMNVEGNAELAGATCRLVGGGCWPKARKFSCKSITTERAGKSPILARRETLSTLISSTTLPCQADTTSYGALGRA